MRILMYHEVSKGDPADILAVRHDRFSEQMTWLRINGYQVCTLSDLFSDKQSGPKATSRKSIALTFDDGPNPHNTPLLLELLAGKGIKATFFVVGRRVRRFRDLLKQTADAGHEIGNHCDHHVPLSFLPRSIISRELEVCGNLVEGVTGKKPRFMRPPMGWFNDKVLEVTRGLGYEPVIGSVHPQDSRQPGLDTIIRTKK